MAAAGEGQHRNRSLKEALFESLTAILSPLQDVRTSGEEQIKALEVTEGSYSKLLIVFFVRVTWPQCECVTESFLIQ